ncbi:katanin p80 WD40 repeat-containing subunit B1 homolog KTN80.4-like isoform X1 [Phoenix dactylifera]|uniref:Katanin p80 WD40 repeat-containing subunit B1 homolog n=1 Tax=Phoenix dactylifera TaxID=42345 RepID=A0A8B8ZHX6_PHODC|nr:katanin p80 WD40 repeat-containing subunit B1 homolog KTN80.4-like isoform X1 [Phoenix dactylifera]XP_038971058.1 katanin p80 WD40 repeat-containing subunit B1 homolog KTN80.4-like isoform X1 [Phoenix dactylifera]
MAATKRAYKLQEFVAHSSNVNCLKIGRRTSRVLVTGGEDHKVNIWAIGKPNAILNLSGHTSAIESVSFDSSEVLVAAGAASGTIKLWDLEEAKVVRTLTGHRSNCISVDFHPFGEFFASGSLDTNLKIWDIRRKGCIHTYKGHTRGVNAIRFTPDGRWIVSGGEDNIVKLWDLTAGKLLHDFKCHEGQIQCIDFHPHEFLLATGSADKTVKFWDLETFELIGSAGPETTGVRSMTFNPDGRTLLCGLHESLKVFSWEPVRCHDAVDVGWSRLSDLNTHEGKLLGCSYNQSCVGVWVVDLSRIEPYAVATAARSNGHSEPKSTSSGNLSLQADNSLKASMGRLSVSQNLEPAVKETKPASSTGSVPGTPQRIGSSTGAKITAANSAATPGAPTLKRSSSKSHGTTNIQTFNKNDVIPVIVPRTSSRVELGSDSRKETGAGRTLPYSVQSKFSDFRKLSNIRDDSDRSDISIQSGFVGNKNSESNEVLGQNFQSAGSGVDPPVSAGEHSLDDVKRTGTGKLGASLLTEPSTSYNHENGNFRAHKPRDTCSVEVPKGGKTRSLVASWEKREQSPSYEGPTPSSSSETMTATNVSYSLRGHPPSVGKETVSANDEDTIADLMEQHQQFLNSAQTRLTKLQVVHRLWERNDIRGVIHAMEKMSDHAVSADVVSIWTERSDNITLDIFTCLLPVLTSLLESKMDRHLGISLEILLKLVRTFGLVIHSTLSAAPSVGVDLQAEQRRERCNLCFIELEKAKHSLSTLTRRGGSTAKAAQELNLALQEVL